MRIQFIPVLLGLAGCLAVTATAQQAEDPAAKMREQLRAALLELRSAQAEIANARAAQAAADAKAVELAEQIKQLEVRNAAIVKQYNEDKATAEEILGRLNETVAEREQRIGQYQKALAEWKAGYDKAAAVAREKEEQRAELASENIVLRRTVADREAKNVGLYKTAMEILERFEKYSLGKAIAAREPFVSATRVKVENMVEGYKDRILDDRVNAPAKNQ